MTSREEGISIGFFGSFYPSIDGLGSVSTGYVKLLSEEAGVTRIIVFAQQGAHVPSFWSARNIVIYPVWKPDSPPSLLRALNRLIGQKQEVDVFFFNVHLTCFGRSRVSNLIGLMIPSLVAILARKPVITYMHNLIETQEPERLGYHPGRLTRLVVRMVEITLARATQLVVPLKSQREVARKSLGNSVESFLIPYIEGINALDSMRQIRPIGSKSSGLESEESPRKEVVLFGFWGPQKDLAGCLRIIHRLDESGRHIHTTVAGPINTHFPAFAAEVDSLMKELPSESFSFLGQVDEHKLTSLLLASDLVILPYNATGGYSGAMNVAALFGCKILAYDLPTLREFSEEVQADCNFVDSRSHDGLLAEVTTILSRSHVLGTRFEDSMKRRVIAKARLHDLMVRLTGLVKSTEDGRTCFK